jgi:hypothetical protein
MSEDDIQEFFVETLSNVSHANGVFRITFAQNEDENSVRNITKLLIPANQLPRILQGLGNAVKTIGEKVQEKREDQKDAANKSLAEPKKEKKVTTTKAK